MTKPSRDASELARSALSELTEAERVGLVVTPRCEVRRVALIAEARNALTEHLNDLTATRYAGCLLEGDAA